MKNDCYIIGKSLVCSLGSTQEQITNTLFNLNQENYEDFLQEKFRKKAFYSIEEFPEKVDSRFFDILKKVIDDVLKDACLDLKEKEDLHIFIGSTSMGVSINEEQNKRHFVNDSEKELSNIGYGFIGNFVEEYIGSKQKSLLFSTACTSSINALSYAAQLIKHKKIKKALIIGIELFNKSTFNGFGSFMLLSQNKVYRPFDKRSDGIILGEGCSAVIVSSERKSDDDFRYLSSANICDNFSDTSSDPSGEPIVQTLKKTLENANINLKDIDLIKAHATGSENNNLSESNALTKLFSSQKIKVDVTALKPYIGHTLGACGTNELIVLLYCIQKGFFPACLGFEYPIDNLSFTPLVHHKNISNKVTVLLNFVAFGGNNSSFIFTNKSHNVHP